MSTQYVKNTDVPNQDSFLWQLGDGWKVSQKTGDVYAPIDTITDEQLGTTLTTISETGKIDLIEYNSYFFVPNKFVDQKTGKVSWSVFTFENRVKANKKLEDIKKFANYQPKVQQQSVPEPVSRPQPQGQQTISKPVTASTISPAQATIIAGTKDRLNATISDTITTYTDPKEVESSNKEYIATLLTDGYSFLPKSLVSETSWTETVYDQETGQEIGKKRIYLMGRIINVKITDK